MSESKYTNESLVLEVEPGVYARSSHCACCKTLDIERAYNFLHPKKDIQKERINTALQLYRSTQHQPKLKLLTVTKTLSVKDL